MPHYREKQNLKSNPKHEESVTALLFFFVLNFEGYLITVCVIRLSIKRKGGKPNEN